MFAVRFHTDNKCTSPLIPSKKRIRRGATVLTRGLKMRQVKERLKCDPRQHLEPPLNACWLLPRGRLRQKESLARSCTCNELGSRSKKLRGRGAHSEEWVNPRSLLLRQGDSGVRTRDLSHPKRESCR
eukprot:384656-Rhodomonas_salina.3